MARQLRVEYPGAIYHATCRMIGERRAEPSRLFVDDADRERLLDRLEDRVAQYGIRLYLFALMTNHFHLVFETPGANCSKFMQSLLTAYTVYYNLRHQRHGHLLDGRFKAKLVEGNEYLLALSRYVHLNPVHVGPVERRPVEERIRRLREYPWSSYLGYIGKRKALGYVEYGPILGLTGGKRREWPRLYRAYVEAGLAKSDDEFKAALEASPRSIGSEGFRRWVDDAYQALMEGGTKREDIAFRRVTEPLPAGGVLEAVAGGLGVEVSEFRRRRRDSPLRAVAAQMLLRYGGLTQRQVAEHLAMGTGGAISAQVRRLPALLAADRRLRDGVAQIERKIEELTAGSAPGAVRKR